MKVESDQPGALMITVLGMAALASAIGVGRFAFTPLMPLMIDRGVLNFGQGAWLASANYLGYLVGALTCSLTAPPAHRAARAGLAAVAVFTLAMGMTSSAYLWAALRFAAGVASAYVLVGVSAWALPELRRLARTTAPGWVFAGVGIGSAIVGLIGLAAGILYVEPAHVWIVLGVINSILAVLISMRMTAPPERVSPAVPVDGRLSARDWRLVLSYGTFGFGYIILATFLPAMARERVADPAVFGWVWPVFGLVAAASTVIAVRMLRYTTAAHLWRMALLTMATGVMAPVIVSSVWSLILAAVLVGGTFMVITMAGMLEAQRQQQTPALKLMAAMTAAFATGQLLGPMVVGVVEMKSNHLINVPSLLAAAGLLIGAWLLTHRHANFSCDTTKRRQP